VEDDEGESVQLDVADESQSPEALLERKLTREAVRRGLRELPEEQRQILLLREIQGMSYDEIADAMAAVVVGGTSMSGGSGKLGGTLIGVLIIGILNNGLNLMGVNSDWQYIIKGAVILMAVYLDFLRSRSRKPTVSLSMEDDDGEEVELDIADDSQSPERLLERGLTRDAVRRGLKALSAEYRQILLLREIQGLSYEEIADVLSLEVGTVKSRIFRARKRLCAFLIEDGNIPDFVPSGNMKGGEKQ
jgi:DNA-directed RNA polymerase specialized sigma24 family protein